MTTVILSGRKHLLFQSTPPVWVVTYEAYRVFPITRISIHTTRVGGDGVYDDTYDLGWISIHTTRVGGDKSNSYNVMGDNIFQSTPPCGW